MSKRKLEEEESDNVESENEDKLYLNRKVDERSHQCPYLDTINRGVLDFDFEKLCSISLSKINCYACLVCGKYFKGLFVYIVYRNFFNCYLLFKVVEPVLMHTCIQFHVVTMCF